MAFDAEIVGTWGCLPEYYPLFWNMVCSKEDRYHSLCGDPAMSQIASVFDEVHKAGITGEENCIDP